MKGIVSLLSGALKEWIVNEAPGFVTTRVNALIGNEAFNMLEAGIASAEDMRKTGHGVYEYPQQKAAEKKG